MALTLKAAGLLDVDAGEIIRPGIVRIEEDRIVGIGGEPAGEVIDLGDSILLRHLHMTAHRYVDRYKEAKANGEQSAARTSERTEAHV